MNERASSGSLVRSAGAAGERDDRRATGNMRILWLYASTYPWEVRVEKMVTSLHERGHEVHLLCANHDRRANLEYSHGVVLHRLRRLPAWARPLQLAVGLPSPLNPLWFYATRALLSRRPFDLLVVRDLHVAPAAIAAGHSARVPVVLDLAENWPSLLREWREREGWNLQNALLRHPAGSRIVERLAVGRADHVLVVVQEMRDRLVTKLGVDPARVSVVMNTPRLLPRESLPAKPRARRQDSLLLAYLGEVHQSRGLDTALHAVAGAREQGLPVRLRIIGRGKPQQERRLRRLAGGLGIQRAVEFLGWRPQAQALGLASEADVGICPFPPNELNDTTISNKMFEYMNLGLPVVCADVKPAKRIMEETGAGLVFAAGSADAMAAAIARFADPAARAACGAAGRRAAEGRYNWETDAAVLEEALLVTAGRRRACASSDDSRTMVDSLLCE